MAINYFTTGIQYSIKWQLLVFTKHAKSATVQMIVDVEVYDEEGEKFFANTNSYSFELFLFDGVEKNKNNSH